MGFGTVESVIHEATWRGCAGTMTGAAELSVGVQQLGRAGVQEAGEAAATWEMPCARMR